MPLADFVSFCASVPFSGHEDNHCASSWVLVENQCFVMCKTHSSAGWWRLAVGLAGGALRGVCVAALFEVGTQEAPRGGSPEMNRELSGRHREKDISRGWCGRKPGDEPPEVEWIWASQSLTHSGQQSSVTWGSGAGQMGTAGRRGMHGCGHGNPPMGWCWGLTLGHSAFSAGQKQHVPWATSSAMSCSLQFWED